MRVHLRGCQCFALRYGAEHDKPEFFVCQLPRFAETSICQSVVFYFLQVNIRVRDTICKPRRLRQYASVIGDDVVSGKNQIGG